MKTISYITLQSNYNFKNGLPLLTNDESIFRGISTLYEHSKENNSKSDQFNYMLVLDSKTNTYDREFLLFITSQLFENIDLKYIEGYSTTFADSFVNLYKNGNEIRKIADESYICFSEVYMGKNELFINEYSNLKNDIRYTNVTIKNIFKNKQYNQRVISKNYNDSVYDVVRAYENYFKQKSVTSQLLELVEYINKSDKKVLIYDDELYGDIGNMKKFFTEGLYNKYDIIYITNPTNFSDGDALDMLFESIRSHKVDYKGNCDIVILDESDDIDKIHITYALSNLKDKVDYYHPFSGKMSKKLLFKLKG